MSLTPHERDEGYDYEGNRLRNHRFGDVVQDPGVEITPTRCLPVPRPLLETLFEGCDLTQEKGD